VRPGLQADGGDLEVLELDGNILTIRYQGACGGCPSAMMGTLQAIESILREEFNPYLEVVAV
jgi:Fe-S cluster biogenesis protein NfuA